MNQLRFLIFFVVIFMLTHNFANATNSSSITIGTTTTKKASEPSSSISVTIYSLPHFHGLWWTMEASEECLDVPGFLYAKASSINTHDACVILFSQNSCKGRNVLVKPGTNGHSDLGQIDFDDTLASLKPCNHTIRHLSAIKSTTPMPNNSTSRFVNSTIITTSSSTTKAGMKNLAKPTDNVKTDAINKHN